MLYALHCVACENISNIVRNSTCFRLLTAFLTPQSPDFMIQSTVLLIWLYAVTLRRILEVQLKRMLCAGILTWVMRQASANKQ